MLDDLIRFLTERLNEDEAAFDKATEAEAEQLRHDGMPTTTAAHIRDYWLNQVPHATHWPRWLAEVEAKRRLLKLHGFNSVEGEGWGPPGIGFRYCTSCGGGGVHEYPTKWPCPTLLAVASVYQDHPDFQEGWRP